VNSSQSEAPPILENPFFHRGPIRDRRYFFGRTAETRRALQMLRKGQCVSIVGPRRIGKTSLLFHLRDPEVQRRYKLGTEYLFVYIDCQGLGDLDKPQFYQWLWREANEALAESGEANRGWKESIAGFRELRDALKKVRDNGYKPVFVFDEFESLATGKFMDRAVFSSLRNLNQELEVVYVTASQMPVDELTYHDHSVLNSPFFSNFVTMPLGFLEPHEAKRMVQDLMGMVMQESYFSKQDLTFGFEVAGYHPFFLQLAFYYLFEQKTGSRELVRADYDTARRQYAEDAGRFFRYTWDHLEEDEQEAIGLVCEEKIDRLDERQKRQLEKKCILYQDMFFSSVFAEFACKQAALEPALHPSVSIPASKEIDEKSSEPRMCRLNITCNKHGWVSVHIAGSFGYQGDSGKILDQEFVERLDRRTMDALHLQDWRFQIKEIGRTLFEELILNRPEIAKGYHRATAYDRQNALHLSLHAPRHFLRLPFEALYSEDEGYLCLKYPMHRGVSGCFFNKDLPSPFSPGQHESQGKGPRALVVASNTWNGHTPPIPEVEGEAKEISELLEQYGFEICWLPTHEATERRVRDELTQGEYLLFHYVGHGSYDPDSPEKSGLHFWEGTMGESEVKKLSASQLEGLVRNTPLRFVYLSNCWGSHTASPATLLDNDFLGVMDGLVMGGLPAVLGFRWPVGDDSARLLGQSFYSAWLGREKQLGQALCEARRTVADQMGRDEKAWFSPILVMRDPDF
jgi:hypothetical protein